MNLNRRGFLGLLGGVAALPILNKIAESSPPPAVFDKTGRIRLSWNEPNDLDYSQTLVYRSVNNSWEKAEIVFPKIKEIRVDWQPDGQPYYYWTSTLDSGRLS